jgi:hypothetical protein
MTGSYNRGEPGIKTKKLIMNNTKSIIEFSKQESERTLNPNYSHSNEQRKSIEVITRESLVKQLNIAESLSKVSRIDLARKSLERYLDDA